MEWQKILNGSDSEAPTLKLEQFGEEGFFYKVIINQKTDTYLYLQETGTSPQYLLMGECRFEELSVWKTEFMRISKAIKQ